MTASEKISKCAEHLFLFEPLMFSVYCTHKIAPNPELAIPFRCGQRKIEYSPVLIEKLEEKEAQDYLKIELIRILLRHPYQRLPINPDMAALSVASDITISQTMTFSVPLITNEAFSLDYGLAYEEYYKRLKGLIEPFTTFMADGNFPITISGSCGNFEAMMPETSGSDMDGKLSDKMPKIENPYKKNSQLSELWGEDDYMNDKISDLIKIAERNKDWGSISLDMISMIEATLVIPLDYKKILTMFRANTISQSRVLTRMRPNRRYGFSYMGSKYNFTTKILMAVDVSGSVCDKDLQNFFSIINRFFIYGIKSIDVVQFDCELTEKILSLKKAKKEIKICGRGGTNFQAPIDYYEKHKEYDGLIIFTDGYAAKPFVKTNRNILWFFNKKTSYDENDWVSTLRHSQSLYL